MDFVKDLALRFVMENGQFIALVIGGLMAAGMALGSAKKILGKLLLASLRGGEGLASKLMEKPKAVALGLGVFALSLLGLWAWHTFTAPKIVVKEVPVVVADDEAVRHLQRQLAQAERAKAVAERAKAAADNEAASAKRLADAEAERKREAEQQAASLAAKVSSLTPSTDRSRMEELAKSFDDLHATGIYDEIDTLKKRRAFNSSKFAAYSHPPDYSMTQYHRECRACNKNLAINKEMDEILKRHPKWNRRYWPDEAILQAEEAAAERKKAPILEAVARRKAAWDEMDRKSREADEAVKITAFGETKTVGEWGIDPIRGKGVTAKLITTRLFFYWPPRKAIEVSVGSKEDKELTMAGIFARQNKEEAEFARRRALPDSPAGRK